MHKTKLSELVLTKRGFPPGSSKLSVRVAAKQAKVSSATMSRIERGGTPDAKTLLKICKWLNVDPREVTL